jgi:hypothetical protein
LLLRVLAGQVPRNIFVTFQKYGKETNKLHIQCVTEYFREKPVSSGLPGRGKKRCA